jgi:predicted nucleic acid-binding protein
LFWMPRLPSVGHWTIRYRHLRSSKAGFAGARALAPALWHLEIANGLAVAERRGILTASDAPLALRQLEQLCAQALDIDADVVPLRQAFETARTYRLSAYDSVYLDLALRARLPLATLDVALRRAAGKAGVALLH